MSQDLVQIGSGAVASMPPPAPPTDDTGFDDLVRLRPGNLNLLQPTTSDLKGGNLGQIQDSVTEESFDTLDVVLLQIHPKRTLYPPGSGFTKGVEPLCRSNDGIYPAEGVKQKQASSCAACPKSKWTPKPDCKEQRGALVIRVDTLTPYYLNYGGASIKTMNEGFQRVKAAIAAANATLAPENKINIQFFKLQLKGKKHPGAASYDWAVNKATRMSADEATIYQDIWRQIKEARAKAGQDTEYTDAENAVDAAVEEVVVVQEV